MSGFNFILQLIGAYWLGRGIAYVVGYAIQWYRGDFILIRLCNFPTIEQRARVVKGVHDLVAQVVREEAERPQEADSVKWPEVIGE